MNPDQLRTQDSRRHRPWLVLARLLWIAIFLLTLVVFCANLLVNRYDLLVVADTSVWFAVGLVLFWRKSTDPTVLLFSLLLILLGGFYIPPVPFALRHDGVWWIPIDVLGLLSGVALSLVYTFPDGRFAPRFTRWLALGWIVVSLVPVPIPGDVYPWNWWLFPPYTLLRLAFLVSLALALLYRYRRSATPVQRQQIKWVVFAGSLLLGIASLYLLVSSVLPYFFPVLGLSPQLVHFLRAITLELVPVLIPLSFGIALLRYRLWDIDTIINRALVYGSLTGLLGVLYAGLIIGLEHLVGLFGGTAAQNPVVLVISTLVIAALVLPVRRRIQNLIDRRFYRKKYDVEKLLASFNATLRQEVGLEQIRERLLAVVQETMQPAHVSLWLHQPERHPADLAHRLELHSQTPASPSPIEQGRESAVPGLDPGW